MNKLVIKDLYFSYFGNPVLQNLQLTVQDGINVILGANGSGKTTLFKMLVGVTKPKKGSIFLNDTSFKKGIDLREQVAYIPQNFSVYPAIRVRELLEFVGQVKYGYKGSQLQQEIERVTELADVGEFLHKRMKNLSEGMRRRVGIAQALIGNPKLIVADEPTAGLDPEQRFNFNLTLQRIPKDRIVLLSTHIIEDIQQFSDQIFVLSKGSINYQGTYHEFAHSLDGRSFEVKVSTQEDLKAVEEKAQILSRAMIENQMLLKVAFQYPPEEGEIPGMQPSVPNLAEVWSYYE